MINQSNKQGLIKIDEINDKQTNINNNNEIFWHRFNSIIKLLELNRSSNDDDDDDVIDCLSIDRSIDQLIN